MHTWWNKSQSQKTKHQNQNNRSGWNKKLSTRKAAGNSQREQNKSLQINKKEARRSHHCNHHQSRVYGEGCEKGQEEDLGENQQEEHQKAAATGTEQRAAPILTASVCECVWMWGVSGGECVLAWEWVEGHAVGCGEWGVGRGLKPTPCCWLHLWPGTLPAEY